MVHPDRNAGLRAELANLQSQILSLQSMFDCLQPNPLHLLTQVRAPYQLSQRLIRHHPPHALLPLAKLCATGPVGRIGTRRALRALATYLLDHILRRDPGNVEALCCKGEVLLPYIHYGSNDPRAPRAVLQTAYKLFDNASDHYTIALFLKGRWLLSMDSLHNDPQQSQNGQQCVKRAAERGCARALVFLAHRYENPQLDRYATFADDVPKGKTAREKFILDLYMRAAEKGDKDALNDVGTSYAQGYGGLEYDFDKAVTYYVKAINAGSVYAYDNLGTHYETGMGGRYPDRVDFRKALYYYRQGTLQHCPKCAHNLGAAYEEGMKDVLEKDVRIAEQYYWHSIVLADSCNDFPTAARSAKDICALLITKMKLLHATDNEVMICRKKLEGLMTSHETGDVFTSVNRDIANAVKGRSGRLKEFLGEENARAIIKRAKELEHRIRGNPQVDDVLLYNHVMGVEDGVGDERKRKTKRAPSTRKRRRT